MSILVQDRESLLYAGREDWWTNDPREAVRFRNVVDAVDYILVGCLTSARVVLKAETKDEDLLLPELHIEPSQGVGHV